MIYAPRRDQREIKAKAAPAEAPVTPTTAPQATTPAPTPTTDTAPTGPQRDIEAEKNTLATIGKKPENEQELLNMAIMTYGDTLPSEFEAIRLKLEQAAQAQDQASMTTVGQDLSALGKKANEFSADVTAGAAQIPGNLKILQDALKMTSGVGAQPLGTSEIFDKANVTGYGALASSLAAHGSEMNQRYESYANLVSKLGAYQYGQNAAQAAKAQLALDNYTQLMEEYQFEQTRLDTVAQRAEDWSRQLELLDRQHQNTLEELDFKANAENGGALTWKSLFPESTGDTYTSSDGTIYVAPGYDSGGESAVLGTKGDPNVYASEFADNCVKYARQFVPNLPYGLWSIRDKANAVDPTIDVPEIGDAMLTAEGPYGHATVVTDYDPETGTITVQEANYKAGTITTGRTISLGDRKILGFIRPDQSKVVAQNEGQALVDQLKTANKNGKFMENLTANVMANKYEGMNPSGAQEYTPTPAYSGYDLASAYANALASTGVKMTDQDAEVQAMVMNYVASGDYEGAKQQIINVATNGLTAAEKSDVRARLAIVSNLVATKDKIDLYEAQGGDMNIFYGGINNVITKIGETNDPVLSDIGANLQMVLDDYTRMQTGAALTTNEEKFYGKLFPSSSFGGTFASSRIDTLVDAMNMKNKVTIGSTIGESLYDKIFSPETIQSERGFTDDTALATESALSNFYTSY